jgi:NADH-quinone oxidoreductase subunit M
MDHGAEHKMGVDGISILFCDAHHVPDAHRDRIVLVGEHPCQRIHDRVLVAALMLGVFMALDLVLFYLFFEAGLIPMFLIIGIWAGGEPCLCVQFFLLYLSRVGIDAGGDGRVFGGWHWADIPSLMGFPFGTDVSDPGYTDRWRHALLWRPLHLRGENACGLSTWLPDAHVQARRRVLWWRRSC